MRVCDCVRLLWGCGATSFSCNMNTKTQTNTNMQNKIITTASFCQTSILSLRGKTICTGSASRAYGTLSRVQSLSRLLIFVPELIRPTWWKKKKTLKKSRCSRKHTLHTVRIQYSILFWQLSAVPSPCCEIAAGRYLPAQSVSLFTFPLEDRGGHWKLFIFLTFLLPMKWLPIYVTACVSKCCPSNVVTAALPSPGTCSGSSGTTQF